MKWKILAALALAELLGLSLWFSASAVTPALAAEWGLSAGAQAWLTMSVQIGFVCGALVSALLNIPDLFNARRVFAVSALCGAACNGAIPAWVDGPAGALILRFFTGFFLAGVYPPGMKIVATWFRKGRGLAIGTVVGALTIGSASPHLLKLLGSPDWRQLMYTATVAAAGAALICAAMVRDGPHAAAGARFNWRYAGQVFGNRGVRLANFGYLGHQWELYAMWTWLPAFLLASFAASGLPAAESWAAAAAFACIGVGGAGCVIAGALADRYGRTTIAIVSMVASGICCLVVGPLFGMNPLLVTAACLVWGFAIIADSAQFSASVTELSDPEYLGTALTLQVCVGFALTLLTIRLLPPLVEAVTWKWAFAPLALGPALGSWAMYRLRRSPAAARLGGEGVAGASEGS